ncbi:MAG: bis(5'-nucleosyl)-tetraphosphatase (symmetrical) YqeK [Firmicutes bacterium]|nr:bis(5'-nucleosyl)-tetraphosphatase (symmetrical) YqeK [Bacillota bacterium]
MTNQDILQYVKTTFKDHETRLNHILGVRETALKLGKKHHADLTKLETAALLHDISKYNSYEKNVEMIRNYFPNHQEILKEFDKPILHSFTAYIVAKEEFGITDPDILNAILYHTVGKADMNIYEKIIFISDYIEPNRTYASCIKVRALAEESLDIAVYSAIDDTIKFHEGLHGVISKQAYNARQFYQRLLEVNHG